MAWWVRRNGCYNATDILKTSSKYGSLIEETPIGVNIYEIK